MKTNDRLLTVKEVAAALNVTPHSLRRSFITTGILPTIRLSPRRTRVAPDALAAFMKARTSKGGKK